MTQYPSHPPATNTSSHSDHLLMAPGGPRTRWTLCGEQGGLYPCPHLWQKEKVSTPGPPPQQGWGRSEGHKGQGVFKGEREVLRGLPKTIPRRGASR